MKQENPAIQLFSWWYVSTFDYRELLKKSKIHLIAMTRDGKIINENVSLKEYCQTAIATTQEGDAYYLLPNSWITPQTETIDDFWLVNANDLSYDSAEIEKIYRIIEAGKIWKKGESPAGQLRLFGNLPGGKIANREVISIVPLGDGQCVLYDGNRCSLIAEREKDPITIGIKMKSVS